MRRILVRDGDHVAKGQILLLLDPTLSGAEATQVNRAYDAVSFDAATTATQESLACAKLADVEAVIRAQRAGSAIATADLGSARAEAAKLRETLPQLEQPLAANEQLLAKGFVSKLKFIDLRRQRISEMRDYVARLHAIQPASAQGAGAASATAKIRAPNCSTNSSSQRRHAAAARGTGQDASALQVLRAPAAGMIGQLAVHTEGGVVEAAKPIMTVVPGDGKMVAEGRLLKRDAGFVTRGQKVRVKLKAFAFARYGMIGGHALSISPDTVDDEKLGPVYVVRVALDRTRVDRGDKVVQVSPGMMATADIVTGSRSYLSYLTSPSDEARGSALRER